MTVIEIKQKAKECYLRALLRFRKRRLVDSNDPAEIAMEGLFKSHLEYLAKKADLTASEKNDMYGEIEKQMHAAKAISMAQ